ncbi:MAG: hypothetical protein AB8E15_04815 [Bdellovibrionales bacterium]
MDKQNCKLNRESGQSLVEFLIFMASISLLVQFLSSSKNHSLMNELYDKEIKNSFRIKEKTYERKYF